MIVRKVDDNQAQLVKQIRCIPGLSVAHTHTIGKGFVDIIIGHNGVNYMCEVKDPAKPKSAKKLTPDEVEFHNNWNGQIAVIETFDDVLKLINNSK